MDTEIGQLANTTIITNTHDKSKVVLTDEKGDIRKQKQISNETKRSKQKVPLAVRVPVDKTVAPPQTKSKTEFTYKEFISDERTKKKTEQIEELQRERGQNDDNAEILGIALPFRSIGERSSLTNLHNLLEQCPQPQPPLLNKQLKTLQLNADQAVIMAEQVQKMKVGMERLQEIIKKFNCTEKFKQDIDFIIANVGPAIAKAEQTRKCNHADCKQQNNNSN